MASLLNQQINTTYIGLLKTTDNGDLSGNSDANAVRISDGSGNDTNLYVSRHRIGVGEATPDTMLHVTNTDTQFKISYNDLQTCTFDVNSDGILQVSPSGDRMKLAKDLSLLTNIIENSQGEDTITLDTDQNVTLAANATVTGDLTITGGKITFGNAEVMHNETDNIIEFDSPMILVDAVPSTNNATLQLNAAANNEARIRLWEDGTRKWAFGNDPAADVFCFNEGANSLSAGSAEFSISTAGDCVVGNDLTVTGNTISGSAGVNLTLGSSGDVTVSGDLTVTGNDIKGSGGTAISFSGVDVHTAGDLKVGGNDIYNSAGAEVVKFIGAGGANDVQFTNNIIFNDNKKIKNADDGEYLSFRDVDDSHYITTIAALGWPSHSAAVSTGLCNIKSSNATGHSSDGWLRVFIGDTIKYIPYFNDHGGTA